jgi:hypothetical protein
MTFVKFDIFIFIIFVPPFLGLEQWSDLSYFR